MLRTKKAVEYVLKGQNAYKIKYILFYRGLRSFGSDKTLLLYLLSYIITKQSLKKRSEQINLFIENVWGFLPST